MTTCQCIGYLLFPFIFMKMVRSLMRVRIFTIFNLQENHYRLLLISVLRIRVLFKSLKPLINVSAVLILRPTFLDLRHTSWYIFDNVLENLACLNIYDSDLHLLFTYHESLVVSRILKVLKQIVIFRRRSIYKQPKKLNKRVQSHWYNVTLAGYNL